MKNFFRDLFARNATKAPAPAVNGHRNGETQAATGSSDNINRILGAGVATYFEALRQSPDRTRLPIGSPYRWRNGIDRNALSQIARTLFDNGGLVGYAVEQIGIYCAPVLPQAASDDKIWNAVADEYFAQWSLRCDYNGRDGVDFASLQNLASQLIDVDGDVGAIAIKEPDGVKIRLAEGPRIQTPASKSSETSVLDGVQLDGNNRVVGYYVSSAQVDTLPSILVTDPDKYDFFPRANMILLREVRATEPYRGLSALRRGANNVRDGADLLAFAKVAWKDYASLRGVVEGGYLDEESGFDVTGDETNPQEPATPGERGLGRMDLLGGDYPVLPPGKTLKRMQENAPSSEIEGFIDALSSIFCAGLGIPPAFFLDSKLTGPNVRAVNGKAQRRFNQRRRVLASLVAWTWLRVIGNAIETRELPAAPNWSRITLQFPPDLSIDAGNDSDSDRADSAVGAKSRQEITGKRGRDWQRVSDQIFTEDDYIIQRCKLQSSTTGVPMEVLLQRHGIMSKPTTPPPGPNGSAPAPAAPAPGS